MRLASPSGKHWGRGPAAARMRGRALAWPHSPLQRERATVRAAEWVVMWVPPPQTRSTWTSWPVWRTWAHSTKGGGVHSEEFRRLTERQTPATVRGKVTAEG